MRTGTLRTDGSAAGDRHDRVVIDRADEEERWRYRCPNGHAGSSWSPTNSHVYCHSCRRQMDAGEDVTPEHYELLDVKTGRTVPWSAVELVE